VVSGHRPDRRSRLLRLTRTSGLGARGYGGGYAHTHVGQYVRDSSDAEDKCGGDDFGSEWEWEGVSMLEGHETDC